MTRHSRVFLAALLCLLALAGCMAGAGFDAGEISKAQRIVVADAGGTERAVLTEEADIDAFVEAMDVDHWRMAELPENLTRSGSFTLWQTETVTVLVGGEEPKALEICTFQCYEDGSYLTAETGLAGISLSFSIPRKAAEYLRSYWQ